MVSCGSEKAGRAAQESDLDSWSRSGKVASRCDEPLRGAGMRWLRGLFSRSERPEQDQTDHEPDAEEGSPFATPLPAIRQGFERIVSGLALEPQRAEVLYRSYADAHRSGDPRAEENVFADALGHEPFDWPWFDEWRERFAELEAWPRMWRIVRHEAALPSPPTSVADAAEYFKLQELRQWVKDRDAALSRSPRGKVEYCQVLSAEVPWEDFRLFALHRHAEMASKARDADMQGKVKLLAHTVSMAVYKARDWERHFKALSTIGRDGWLFLLMEGDEPEPIETLTRRFFNENFAAGHGEWPPYFPGDCSLVVLTRPEWEARRSGKVRETGAVAGNENVTNVEGK